MHNILHIIMILGAVGLGSLLSSLYQRINLKNLNSSNNSSIISVTKTLAVVSNIIQLLNKHRIQHFRYEELNSTSRLRSNLEDIESHFRMDVVYKTVSKPSIYNLLIDRLHYEFFQREQVKCLFASISTEPYTIAKIFVSNITSRIEKNLGQGKNERTWLQNILRGKKYTHAFTHV